MTGRNSSKSGDNSMTTSKRALITGGNRGIGLAIAQGLLDQGYEVIITARSFERAKQAAEQLSGTVIPIELDVSDDRSVERAIATLSHDKPLQWTAVEQTGGLPALLAMVAADKSDVVANTPRTPMSNGL
jgi:NAD(P)-dependent dehydrogenase (short-subunit alcohol dehydrogenase family)